MTRDEHIGYCVAVCVRHPAVPGYLTSGVLLACVRDIFSEGRYNETNI